MNSCDSIRQTPLAAPEQALWIAVINTALDDALSSGDPALRERARRWFLHGGEDFQQTCDLANLDAGSVRRRVLSLIGPDPVTRH